MVSPVILKLARVASRGDRCDDTQVKYVELAAHTNTENGWNAHYLQSGLAAQSPSQWGSVVHISGQDLWFDTAYDVWFEDASGVRR